jgi:DNA-binding IclR family transcriptional regulator
MKRDTSQPVRTVAERVLAILEVFSTDRPMLRLSDISRHTGMPLTTTHRLVRELVSWGALERDDRGAYWIGLRLWEVGALAPRGLGLREAALPFMQDLYEATHENVQLAVRDGCDGVYVERITGWDAVTVRTRVGARWPLHATGVGLILLAHAPAAIQERVLTEPLARFTEKTVTDPHRLRRILTEVRRTGFSISDGQITLDALSVAAPVRDGNNEVVAALSLVVRNNGADPMNLTTAVRAAAQGVSRVLRSPGIHRPAAVPTAADLLVEPIVRGVASR